MKAIYAPLAHRLWLAICACMGRCEIEWIYAAPRALLYGLRDSEGTRAVNYLRRARCAEAALRELVSLEDMRLRLRKLHEMGHGTDYADYHRLLPLAWDAARQVVGPNPAMELRKVA